MKTGVVNVKASCCAFPSKFSILVLSLFLVLLPQHASAATSNAQLEQYVINLCGNPPNPLPAGWNALSLAIMCTHLGGAASSGGVNVSANLGIATAGGEVSARKKKKIRGLEETNKKNEKAASGDEGAWGFVVTPQYGENTRSETNLENGYRSKLSGLLVGVDYRFSDRFVFGATVSSTQDKATFFNGAGSLKTGNTSLIVYGTWLAGENISLDGYLGSGKTSFDSQRKIDWATTINNGFFGTVTGNTTGRQTMAGLSASLQKDVGGLNVSPFLNVDYVKTRINGYNETGTTTIEMHYGDRNIASLTSSLGLRLDKSFSYDWGMLIPSVRLASVHEFQSRSQQIKNELVITPGGGFNVATDSATRNYLNSGFGVVAALNRGVQLFFDYDKRSRDQLLNSWAVNVGVLIGN